MVTKAKPTMGEIQLFGKSVEDLFQGGQFPDQMYSLVELRQAYHNPQTGVRESIHNALNRGEWLADVVDMDGAKEQNGFLVVNYIQKPTDILKSLKAGKYSAQGGTRISYACPPDGWVVPADGKLWHPETGAAIATVEDRGKAVREVAKYIERHPEEFAGFEGLSGKNPKELAEIEISYQWAPVRDSGVRAVRRGVWDHGHGPFDVRLIYGLGCGGLPQSGLRGLDDDVGARLRSKK